jgi:hypothetical protein
MGTILTNPNRYLVNVPELQNVVTSATGNSSAKNFNVTQLLNMIDVNSYIVKTNYLQAYSGSNITVRNNLNLSNSIIYYNNVPLLYSNGINASNNQLFYVNNQEVARFTAAGYLGIGVQAPLAPLDVDGDVIVRQGNLYLSRFGLPSSLTMGNMFADGDVYAQAFLTPSDPKLKKDATPYVPKGLPKAVEFTWIASGQRDIGVFADDVQAIEPLCVERDKKGVLHVDYPKLVTLCLAEIHDLQTKVEVLESTTRGLQVIPPVSP